MHASAKPPGLLFQCFLQFLGDGVVEFSYRRVLDDILGVTCCATYARVEDLPGLITTAAGV